MAIIPDSGAGGTPFVPGAATGSTTIIPNAPVIPPATPPATGSSPSAGAVSKAAKPVEVTLQSVSAQDQIISVLYGYPLYLGVRFAGIVADANLNLLGILGYGQLSQINEIYIDDKVLGTPPAQGRYYGTQTQTVDAVMKAAYASHFVTFNDAMPGIAYVRISIPKSADLQSFPNVVVKCGGKIVTDMRTRGIANGPGMNNPVLCLADYISSTVYGLGGTYDVASFAAAANFCDEATPDGPRYTMALALTTAQRVEDQLAQLVAYTGCMLWRRGGVYHLTPMKARAPVRAIDTGDIIQGSFEMTLRAQRDLPTRVTTQYTDWTTLPPSTRPASQDNATSGNEERESKIAMPGFTTYAMASRFAGRRLNQIWYGQLAAQWRAFDEALNYAPGDVVTVNFYELGLSAALMNITAITDQGFGRYAINAESYNDAAFTDNALPQPPQVDPSELVPSDDIAPIFPGPVTMVWELIQYASGDFRPRLDIAWTGVVDASTVSFYSVQIFDVTAGKVIETGNTPLTTYVSGIVVELHTYRADVVAVGVNSLTSNVVSSPLVPVAGKTAPPSNVQNFSAIEAGGNVYCAWSPVPDPDRDEYEIRRGAVGAAWGAMVVVTKLHATNTVLNSQPVGTSDFAIKAKDTSGNYSVLEARQTVNVTQDQNINITGPNPFIGYSVSNVSVWAAPPGSTPVMVSTNLAGLWGDGADNPDNTVGTFADSLKDVVISVPANAAGWIQTSAYDFTITLNTAVSVSTPYDVLYGPVAGVTALTEVSTDNVNWSAVTQGQVVNARYVRTRLNIAAGTSIRSLQNWTVSLIASTTTEQNSVAVSASGHVTIALVNQYATWVAIQVTPQGSVANVVATFDNVVVGKSVSPNTFDIYLFKSSVPAAGTVSWSFRGVR
jgi:hypothetical protein